MASYSGVAKMLRELRNAVISNAPTQGIIVRGARSGIIPKAITRYLPPIGTHTMTSPAGKTFSYVATAKDQLARSIVWDDLRSWETSSLKAWSELVCAADLVLDVGAYTGIYSLIACADGPTNVIAFEPNPQSAVMLRDNVLANGLGDRIEVFECGASNEPGKCAMEIPHDTTAARIDRNGSGPIVNLVTIDQVVSGRAVQAMKIDVEGLEIAVCQGAADTIRRSHPSLIIEILNERHFGQIAEFFSGFGYTDCVHLGHDGVAPANHYVDSPNYANFLWR